MPTDVIYIHGQKVETLRELLRPGLSAIFVGLNPSPVSVNAGHYYQGRLGLRFWRRLQDYGLTTELPRGREDEVAFEQGYGFTDLVRRPTARARDLAPEEVSASVEDLIMRIGTTGESVPVVCTFAIVFQAVHAHLEKAGHRVLRMPPPYARREIVAAEMTRLPAAIRPAPEYREPIPTRSVL